MMRKDQHLVMVVVDELGNALGLLTLPYLVRHALGADTNPLSDRVTKGRARIKTDDATGSKLVDASTPIVVINEEFGLEISTMHHSTLAGFMLGQFGTLPGKNAKFIYEGYEFKVVKIDQRRIVKVKIKKTLTHRLYVALQFLHDVK